MLLKYVEIESSGQDGHIGRNALLPYTTKRRITTNLKTKNSQNYQKIKLHGSPITKELKKHSSRPVGGAETGSQGREDAQQGDSWWTERSHICVQIKQEGQLGRETVQPRVPARGNKASEPLAVKTCGGCSGRRNSQPHRRVHWRDPQSPRMYTNPSTRESALVWEGPILLVGSGESD